MNYNQNYSQQYRRVTYKINNKVVIDELLNDLHTMQLDMIDEALEKSDLKEANDIIAYIKAKL